MAEILIKVTDYVHSDPEKDRAGVHKRGDIINIKPDGWSDRPNWLQSSYPYARTGKFIVVKVPDATISESLRLRSSWHDDFGYEILSSQPAQGRYTVRVFEKNLGVSNQNELTASKVQAFLEKWGCTDLAFSANSCRFVFSLWNAVRSNGFWQRDDSKVSFALISYNSDTGIGRISANCELVTDRKMEKYAEMVIVGNGGTIVGWDNKTVTFEVERSTVLQKFSEDVKSRVERVYKRHKYSMLASVVDDAIAAGGVLTMTRAQFLQAVRDHMAE